MRSDFDENYKVLEFKEFGDEKGNLVVAEGSGFDIPFDIRSPIICEIITFDFLLTPILNPPKKLMKYVIITA